MRWQVVWLRWQSQRQLLGAPPCWTPKLMKCLGHWHWELRLRRCAAWLMQWHSVWLVSDIILGCEFGMPTERTQKTFSTIVVFLAVHTVLVGQQLLFSSQRCSTATCGRYVFDVSMSILMMRGCGNLQSGSFAMLSKFFEAKRPANRTKWERCLINGREGI